MKEVVVTISKDGGEVKLDAKGFTGGACKDFTKALTDSLGTVEKEEKKPEFYQTGNVGVNIGGR